METKQRLDKNNIEGRLKTIAGFSNTSGGKLFIGVEDGTNKLIGFDRNKEQAKDSTLCTAVAQ